MNKYVILVPHHPDYSYGSSFEAQLPQEAGHMGLKVLWVNRADITDVLRQVEQYVHSGAVTLLAFHGNNPTRLDPENVDDGMDYVPPDLIKPLIDTGRVFIGTYGSESEEEIRFLLDGPQGNEVGWVQRFDEFWCERRLATEKTGKRRVAYEKRFDQLSTKGV